MASDRKSSRQSDPDAASRAQTTAMVLQRACPCQVGLDWRVGIGRA